MALIFGSNSYQLDSLKVSAQRCVNGYAEFQPPDAKTQVPIFGSPGITTFVTVGHGPIRGMFRMGSYAYAVSGTEFWRIDRAGTTLLLGTGIGGLNVVSIDGSTAGQIVIVNGVNGWYYDTASTASFVQIADPQFNAAATATFIDGYFVFDWLGTNKWFISGLLAGSTYAALDFASAESHPDNVLAVKNRKSALLVFGEETIEIWDHTGASTFPFQKIKGATIDRGIAAALALASEDDAIFMLGEDRVFYRFDGGGLKRISTHAIEKAWQAYSTVDDAFCFPLIYGGHKWIVLTFPTIGKTWVTDIATNYLWHERVSYDSGGAEVKWRANAAVKAFGKQLVGDANSGKIGYLDRSVFTEFGDDFYMELISPPIHGDGKTVFMPKLELDVETGVGLRTGQGSDPQVMMSYSDDGGNSWSDAELWAALGATGNANTTVEWNKLGSFQERCIKIRISDPVKRVVLGARTPNLYVGAF